MSNLNTRQRLLLLQLTLNLDAEIAAYDLAIATAIYQERRMPVPQPRPKKKRKYWVKPWLLKGPDMSQFKLLMEDLMLRDVKAFHNFTRMQPDMFFTLLDRLEPRIRKLDTKFRKAIPAATRLALTLRFYATGDSYMSLSYNFYIQNNTISKIVREVSEAIIAEYSEEVLSPPVTPEKWKEVAKKFEDRWNFPHAVGALDGKHISIKCPKESGTVYFNYKGYYSIVMLALVDAEYKFLWVDVGANGGCSDAQLWNDCELKDMVVSNEIGLPQAESLVPGEQEVSYFIIGDDAFALNTYMMKPYSKRDLTRPERIFNYRLSRARRIVENAFGILACRFRCILGTMQMEPKTVESVVLACCCLHNLLRSNVAGYLQGQVDDEDPQHNLIAAPWRAQRQLNGGQPLGGGNVGTRQAKEQRDYLKNYLNSPQGAVDWQERMITLRPNPQKKKKNNNNTS